MIRVFFVLVVLGMLASIGGCAAVGEFIQYGVCEDAEFRVRNSTPFQLEIAIGGDPKSYVIAPADALRIPGRFPIYANVRTRKPITASVVPFNPLIRDGGTTWDFYNSGGYYYSGLSGGYTQGKEVHATVELQDPTMKSTVNALVFKVHQ